MGSTFIHSQSPYQVFHIIHSVDFLFIYLFFLQIILLKQTGQQAAATNYNLLRLKRKSFF